MFMKPLPPRLEAICLFCVGCGYLLGVVSQKARARQPTHRDEAVTVAMHLNVRVIVVAKA